MPILEYSQVIEWPNNIEAIKEAETTSHILTDIGINEQVFAIASQDESLEPKFCIGAILIFDPLRSVKNKDFVILVHKSKHLPQVRQILIDGPDIYVRSINPLFQNEAPTQLDRKLTRIAGVLIQAKANYI